MARQVIGDNPLDMIVPAPLSAGRPSAKSGVKRGAGNRHAEAPAAGGASDATATSATAPGLTPAGGLGSLADPRPPGGLGSDAVSGQYLTFLLGPDAYGLRLTRVREIVEYPAVTRVPATPVWIRGVVNLRGAVVPVLDLAARFDLPEVQQTQRTCLVIVEVLLDGDTSVMALVADSVIEVIDFDISAIVEPPTFGTRIHLDYLLGLGKKDEELVLLLDLDRILSIDELREAAGLDGLVSTETGSPPPEGPEEE